MKTAAWIALLSLALVPVAGCGPREATAKAAPPAPKVDGERVTFAGDAPQLRSLKVEPVERKAEAPLRLTGRLVWDEDVTARVLPPVAGRVASIAAPLGAHVARGDVLATVSAPDFGQAQADAARAGADLAASRRTRDRLARLAERGAAPRKDLEAAEADLARATAEAGRAEARLARWGGAPGTAIDQVIALRSPVAGTVVERAVNPGLEVRPDAPSPLFVVTDPHRLWVLLDVAEPDLAAAVAGARLSLSATAYPGRTFPAVLDLVGASLDPATRTLKARGTVDNREGLLKAEMYVTAELWRSAAGTAAVVPARAVLSDGEKRFVFVEEGPGAFRRTPVTVGRERDGAITVVSGLPDGARVVTDGSILLASLLSGGPG